MSLPITDEQRRTLLTLMFAAFASQASIRLCDSMLPQLADDFGGAVTDAAGVVTAFTVAYGLFQLFYGPLGDRFGKLPVVTVATLAAAIGSLACAFAPGLGALTGLRFATGAACAALIPLSLAWIGDSVEYEHRQRTLARFLTGSTSGLIFGQIAGGAFADTLGWRLGFGVLAAVLAIVTGALVLRLRAQAGASQAQVRAAVSQPASTGAGRFSTALIARQFAGVLSLPWARAMLCFVFFEGAVVFGATAFIPTYLHLGFEMPLWKAGVVVAGFGAGGLAYALGSAWLIPRLGERGLVCAGGLFFALAVATIGSADLARETIKCFFAGAGFFMLHNTLQTLATQMAPRARGTAISAFAFGLFAGQSAGVALAAVLVAQVGFPALFVGSGLLVAALAATVYAAISRRARA